MRDLFNQIGAAHTSAYHNMRTTIEVFGATSLIASAPLPDANSVYILGAEKGSC